jgi:hypothetical protein
VRLISVIAAFSVFLAVCVTAQEAQIVVPNGLLVTDANGKDVGLVVDLPQSNFDPTVVLAVDGIVVGAFVESTSLFPFYSASFATTDCTGTAYVSSAGAAIGGNMWTSTGGAMAGPAWTVFRFMGPPPNPPIQLQSMLVNGSGGCVPISGQTQSNMIPAERVVDLRPLFVPPFKIEAFVMDPTHCIRRKLSRAN